MDSELLPTEPTIMQRALEAGPLSILSVALIAISAALFLIWLFLVIRRRRVFPLIVVGAIIFGGGGLSLHRHLSTLRSHNLDSIHLLTGYTLVHRPGDDTYVGSITRPGGLRIQIDIGAMSGLWANPAEPAKHLWVIEQTIRGHTVFIGVRPHGTDNTEKLLCVTYPRGAVNFFAVVHAEQDIAEMLCMILTHEPIA